jgi:hypothetical protein
VRLIKFTGCAMSRENPLAVVSTVSPLLLDPE